MYLHKVNFSSKLRDSFGTERDADSSKRRICFESMWNETNNNGLFVLANYYTLAGLIFPAHAFDI